MTQEHHEEIVGYIIVSRDSLLLLSEVVGEARLEVGRARGQDDLVAVDGFSFDHKCNIAKFRLVQNGQEVALVDVSGLHACAHHAPRLLAKQASCACCYPGLLGRV